MKVILMGACAICPACGQMMRFKRHFPDSEGRVLVQCETFGCKNNMQIVEFAYPMVEAIPARPK